VTGFFKAGVNYSMKYLRIKPPPSLSAHVRYFWIGEVGVQFTHHAIATSSPKMVFHYKGSFDEITASGKLQRSFSSGIQGQSKKHTQFIAREPATMFGIEFFPYVIPSLFSIPATALTDQYIDLTVFLGRKGRELEERIQEAGTTEERIRIATRFLESRLHTINHPFIIDAINQINAKNGLVNMAELAKTSPVSQRQFERLFKELAGFTPKLYARVKRFETALCQQSGTLTQRALDAGYADQSHFIRDFRDFTGLQPRNYFKATANLADVENVQF